MIKELTKLANHLDAKGLTKEADYLDAVIRKNAERPIPFTTEEVRTICKRNRTFADELKEANDKLSEAQKLVSTLQEAKNIINIDRNNWCWDLLQYAEEEEHKEKVRQQKAQDADERREQMWGRY